MSATIYSHYMSNIEPEILRAQTLVVRQFLPDNWEFKQIHRDDYARNYTNILRECVITNPHPVTIFLDVDCIPLSRAALVYMEMAARSGALIGGVQRANHIQNNEHLYVGPSCMGLSHDAYWKYNAPSFAATDRGDWAEELTYRWEELNAPVKLLLPIHVAEPQWKLRDGKMFGYGTNYDNLFFHAFGCNRRASTKLFLDKCREVLQ